MLIKSSARALAIALLPLAFIHAVLLALALLNLFPSNGALRLSDSVLASWIGCIALDGAILFLGHLVARHFGSSRRATYALIGGIAGTAGYIIAMNSGLWIGRPASDMVVLSGILPTFFGMISGFLYAQMAGYEPNVVTTPAAIEAKQPAPYDGPIQVRTSIAAIAIAALIPASLMAIIALFVSALAIDVTDTRSSIANQTGNILLLMIPAQLFILSMIATSVPTAIFASLVHALARSMRRTSMRDYAMAGSLAGLALGTAFSMAGGVVLLVPCVILGAIIAVIYRGLAGIEPLSLPEPVLARTTEALVAADHPLRKAHIVVTDV